MRQGINRLRFAAGLMMAALPLAAVLPGAGVAGAREATPGRTAPLEIVDLGVLPGGTTSFANDLNDRGDVVGYSDVGETISHAVLWSDGEMTDLGTLGGGPRDSSVASAVNERGQIAGFATVDVDSGDFSLHAVLWRDGEIVDLGTLGGAESMATDINDRGEVVGLSATATGETHAFLWRRGRMLDLGTPEGEIFSMAKAINNRGQVVGAGSPVPFVWQRGVWSNLPAAPGTEASAEDNNDRGHVAGIVIGGVAVNRAVVWQGGLPVDLGFPEDEGSQALAINNRDQIAGVSFLTGAFVWDRGRITRLPSLVGLASAVAINERGQVAGYSPTQEGIDPHYHAVIWR
jgi:probable HAF family extracellular repeat protein